MCVYKLAIIIPSWNSAEYIGGMIEGIIANTFKDWKCFVVDDQSTDNSCEVVNAYSQKDERIILAVRNREPKGAQTCRNIGFELSKGAEYVIWFDADDLIAPYCFKQRVEYMDRHSELDFGVFPAKTFEKEIWDITDECCTYGIRFGEDPLGDMLKWCLPMVGWTNIYRRTSVLKFNLKWDEKVLSMQDSDFNISALVKGMKYGYAWDESANTDYFYRKAENKWKSVSIKIFGKEHLNSHLYLLEKIFSSLSSEQKKKYKRNLECYSYRFAELLCQSEGAYKCLLSNRWISNNHRLHYGLFMYRAVVIHYPFNELRGLFNKVVMLDNLQEEWQSKQKEWLQFSNANAYKMVERQTAIK